jgi:apolipoprotein N-acyltransferase
LTFAALAHRVVLAWGWERRLIAAAAGAVSALAMAPFNLLPVLAVTLPVFVWLLDGAGAGWPGLRASFAIGWWFGFGYFIAGLYWMGFALLVEADRFAWAVPLAVIAIPAGLAMFTGLGAALARALWTTGPTRILAFAAALALSEYLRGHLLTGFPWNSFGYALAAVPIFAQGAALVGLWGLTLLTLAAFASPAALVDGPETNSHPWRPILLSAFVLAALGGYGAYRTAGIESTFVDGVRIRIMQPNLPQGDKFKPAAKQQVMDRYVSISDRNTGPRTAGVRDATLLIWPESAFPFFLEREADALARIADLLPPGVPLVTGAVRLETAPPGTREPRVFNSVRVLGDDGAILATYDKVHLVPFGEFLPFQRLLESVGLEQLTRIRGGFAAGARPRALSVPGVPPAAPLICYEAIFPRAVVPTGERPGWLLNLTNDAWFGNSPGPHQHFAQARLRTIEEGLPLVRAANTGISAVVDPLGRVIRSLPLGVDGVIDAPLPKAIEPPVYARIGDVPFFVLITAFALMAYLVRRRQSRKVRAGPEQR